MERIFNIIRSDDFNLVLTNLLIDLYSPDYEKYFEELMFDEDTIEQLNQEELDRLTKISAIIEYVGNRQPKAKLYNWIYSNKLKLEDPFVPGIEEEGIERVKRIFFAAS